MNSAQRRDRTDGLDRRAHGGASWAGIAAVAAGALAVSALVVRNKTRQAEREHPPLGQFMEIDGVRLHYIERGQGKPLVLLHGNGSMVEDFALSGFLDQAARQYRVIAFDRPGFGHSDRPRNKVWTPAVQAELLHKALRRLGVEHCLVVGQSWGSLVALTLAMEYPTSVRGMVLVSGCYYPAVQMETPLLSASAIPVVGDLLCHTVSPLLARWMWPSFMRRLFGPTPVPARFAAGYPLWMALRPEQLRATAGDNALMIPALFGLKNRYSELEMPIILLAGADDRHTDTRRHSERLHRELARSELRIVPDAGHMLHYSAPEQIVAAIEHAEKEAQMFAAMQTVRNEELGTHQVH